MFSDSDEDPTGLDGADFANVEFASGSEEEEPSTTDTPSGIFGAQHLVGRQLESLQEAVDKGLHFDQANLRAGCTSPGLHTAKMPAEFAEGMATRGFAVMDGIASPEWCAALRQDIVELAEKRLMSLSQNKIALDRNEEGQVTKGEVVDKGGVFELDVILNGHVVRNDALTYAGTLREFYQGAPALIDALNEACPRLALESLDTIKVQYNDGQQGCFPIHYDTTTDSSRRLTCILYLNPDWTEGHGGELRVYPFPFAPALVQPLMGTLACFSSTLMAHRTMPAGEPRVCLSLWFTSKHEHIGWPERLPIPGPEMDRAKALGIGAEELQRLQRALLPAGRPERILLSKVLFQEEWADSLAESFGESMVVAQSVALHFKDAELARKEIEKDAQLARLMELLPLEWEQPGAGGTAPR
jgi:Rps23 Pro-64 3,4-dihydroxylase Tpa1-like proline 4-hydroxylase